MRARNTVRAAAMGFFAVVMLAANPGVAGATPPACVGDCDGSGDVTVDEVVTMVATALGSATAGACAAGDADGGGSITVDEVITAVTNALNGCAAPQSTPTPAVTDTPAADVTETLTSTPTEGSNQTETPEPTETGLEEATETETPEPTATSGMPGGPTAATTQTAASTPTQAEPTATAEGQATATPEAAATQTAEPPPASETPAIPPTVTPVFLPTETPGEGGGAVINLGTAAGTAGSTVAISATLSGGNGVLTATSNDIFYDASEVNVAQTGGVGCTVNPAIGPGSPFGKMLLTSVAPQTGTTTRLRIGLISFTVQNAIPDGPLFTCQFEISPTANPGAIILQNHPEGSTAFGEGIAVGGSNGLIMVE